MIKKITPKTGNIFKSNDRNQTSFFTVEIDRQIPQNDLVRLVDKVINAYDISPILAEYKGGGASSYHPRMLLKALLYAYCLKSHYTMKK